jgi:hypothetical protein
LSRYSFLCCTAVLCLAAPARGQVTGDFDGTYSVTSPGGPLVLSVRQDADGTISGTLAMPNGGPAFDIYGAVLFDEDGEPRVHGTLSGTTGTGQFDFAADAEDGGFYLRVTPCDASGPRPDLSTVYFAERRADDEPGVKPEGGGGVTAPPPDDGAHDLRLVGTWAAQVIMNTPSGAMATQLFMEIRADGELIDLGSRAIGGTPDVGIETDSPGNETARWRSQGKLLQVSYAGSAWVSLARYEVRGDQLLLEYYDGDRKLWYRQH